MKNLVNHPGFQLRDDAADSLARYERDHGRIGINSAYRSQATQDQLIYRYDHPRGPQDMPPNLFKPAKVSNHTKGTAFDTSDYKRAKATLAEYGFFFNFGYDPVHAEYDPARDRHKPSAPKPAPAKSGRPTLKRGSKGADVKFLQKQLNKKYPAYSKLNPDGDFGAATEGVVKELQRRAKLVPDGVVGTNTWKWVL